ncbi:RRP15-like protein [Penaeus japonicus]|uniref:RRP15-like protein n=1 Tax=Penaeus japonicus TaxID=27405 RepID=UPI001C70CFD2|nr:RRP15-like protein [Penaeus japonicus]
MAVSNGRPVKKPRVVEEQLDSDERDLEEVDSGSDNYDFEPGDDLEDIKQEVEDWNDTLEEVEMEQDDFTEEIKQEEDNDNEGFEQDSAEEGRNGQQEGKAWGEGDDNFGDVESGSEDEESGSEKGGKKKKKKKKKVKSKGQTKKTVRIVTERGDLSDSDADDLEEDDGDDNDSASESGDDGEEDTKEGGMGLANVLTKILKSKKKGKEILNKAKKDNDRRVRFDEDFEVVDDKGTVRKIVKEEEVKNEVRVSQFQKQLERRAWINMFHVKPTILDDREKEKKLKVMATQGVVQLFGAIEKHKSIIGKKMAETKSVIGRETLLENTGKEEFLRVLKRKGKQLEDVYSEDELKKEFKEEPDEVPGKKPRWSVLSDNFYKEPTLQGWDQESDEDE